LNFCWDCFWKGFSIFWWGISYYCLCYRTLSWWYYWCRRGSGLNSSLFAGTW